MRFSPDHKAQLFRITESENKAAGYLSLVAMQQLHVEPEVGDNVEGKIGGEKKKKLVTCLAALLKMNVPH